MDKLLNKQRLVLCFVLVCFAVPFLRFSSFATSYEEPNMILGPNSTEGGKMHIDGKNYALESLQNVMDGKDFLLAMIYVSDYRKGDKDAKVLLRELVAKYNVESVDQIINYIIQDNTVKLIASFTVDHSSNQLSFVQVNGLTTSAEPTTVMAANALWQKIIGFVPKEFSDNINVIHIDFNKAKDNMVTVNAYTEDIQKWELSLDVSLLDDSKNDELYKNLVYATTFYYVLKSDQIDSFSYHKENYTYQDRVYKDNSYINKFYNKFWKGRRKEVNTDQYDLYKNEFLDRKASRTVYDDMAVSFYNYVVNGTMKRYLGFRADKNNFFDDYQEFKQLAKTFRIKLGIRMS